MEGYRLVSTVSISTSSNVVGIGLLRSSSTDGVPRGVREAIHADTREALDKRRNGDEEAPTCSSCGTHQPEKVVKFVLTHKECKV